MAVPTTGTLSMQDIAQERLNSTYGSGSVTGPISMYNLVNGGNTGGAVTSGNTYPAVNTGCLPNPASRNAYVQLIELIKYTNNVAGTSHTFYIDPSEATSPGDLANGDKLYTDADLTTVVAAHNGFGNYYLQDHGFNSGNTFNGLAAELSACNGSTIGVYPPVNDWLVSIGSGGVITIAICSCTSC
tara:strand:+ start:1376 stop:1933 length:558 start_codon:yes stop_codon:yes gene_type:complete